MIDTMDRATVEAVLRMSAEQLAGPKNTGRRDDDRAVLAWPPVGSRRAKGTAVDKPRLRKKSPTKGEGGEVAIPAHTAMLANGNLGRHADPSSVTSHDSGALHPCTRVVETLIIEYFPLENRTRPRRAVARIRSFLITR